ncbi:MAG: hypothetical protein WC134_04990 [Acholeplasmataceae bacterium]|jgi:hypothetical protein|nr:hypothetical protein [Acholeplasmataceae bacterium]MDD4194743.1 hypothetical protein [Acholeplasmataceae bacterium]MDY0338498.1 hypothetical protein [Acholeplasmataceae bacterium]
MANNKKQQPKKAEIKQTQTTKPVVKKNEKKEPSKQEIMFFRIGIIVITLTIAVAAIIMLVTYFMDKETEEQPFTDQLQITEDDLVHLMINDPTFGYVVDRDYFTKYDNYSEWLTMINSNDEIFIYFYKSSEVNLDTETIINDIDFEGEAFFFLDLDVFTTIYENENLEHLNLLVDEPEMLVIFNTVDQGFETIYEPSSIQLKINEFN